MLKGKIDVYDFSMKVEGDVDDISRRLKEIFYDNISSVEQLYVKKVKGKVVVSFIKIRSNFANILDEDGNVKTVKYNDYTFEEFIDQKVGLIQLLYPLILQSHLHKKSKIETHIEIVFSCSLSKFPRIFKLH